MEPKGIAKLIAVSFTDGKGNIQRGIVSYMFADKAAVLVQPQVTSGPDKEHGCYRAGLTTSRGVIQIVPLERLEPIVDGWQLFVGQGEEANHARPN